VPLGTGMITRVARVLECFMCVFFRWTNYFFNILSYCVIPSNFEGFFTFGQKKIASARIVGYVSDLLGLDFMFAVNPHPEEGC